MLLLLASVLVSMALCYRYVRSVNGAQLLEDQAAHLQAQVNLANRYTAIVEAMAKDAVDYSKRNPAIDPILQQFDLKPKPGARAGGR